VLIYPNRTSAPAAACTLHQQAACPTTHLVRLLLIIPPDNFIATISTTLLRLPSNLRACAEALREVSTPPVASSPSSSPAPPSTLSARQELPWPSTQPLPEARHAPDAPARLAAVAVSSMLQVVLAAVLRQQLLLS
jgi:hypothetical protein